MQVSEAGFAEMTKRLLALGRPIVAVLEGGYDLVGLSRSSVAMMRALLDPTAPSACDEEPAKAAHAIVHEVSRAIVGAQDTL